MSGRERTSPLDRASLEQVLLPLAEARSLPAAAYTDDSVLAFERRAILAAGWTCLGRESDVMTPGSWITAEIACDSVIVMRGDDLELRAFYNLCVHRGVPLLSSESGRCANQTLTCQYHGWTYGTTGRLLSAPHTPPGFAREAHGLRPLRVETWQGFVFATRDREAPPVTAWMGTLPPWLAQTPLGHLVSGRTTRWETGANWKWLVANFQESHHFTRVHPELEKLTPNASAMTHHPPGSQWLGGTMEIEAETVSRSGKLQGRPRIVREEARRVCDAMLFPTLLTSLQPDYFLTYRLEPLSATRTRVVADVLFHPAAKAESFPDVFDLWDTINAEDKAICEAQQVGVSSLGFVPGPYTTVDEGVHAFEQMIARRHLA